VSLAAPSSGPSDRLPPQEGEGADCNLTAPSPSPLVGEGARRADEGGKDRSQRRLQKLARSMRHQPTEAEHKLWLLLRDRRFIDHKFRRQVPIGPYVADYVCYSAKLIVEADGSQHAESLRDTIRDAELTHRGFRIVRFWNHDILARPDLVLEALWHALTSPSSVSAAPSHLLPRGEKGSDCNLTALSPSPLVGEGARRADEGDLP
jgi:very-short-patch-repair endonuclease